MWKQSRKSAMHRAMGACVLAVCLWGGSGGALALENFDFETSYLVQPGQQIWDFSLVRHDGQYHAFYHTIPQQNTHPANADTIWHAVSADLRRWDIQGAALTVGPDPCDAVAMWAPDVVWDEGTQRWAMLYTGVGASMVQRACLAWSDDLETWTKSPANPVFAPDSLTYHWGPEQAWSSFRDPFVYHDGAQWNMLSTAGLRLGGYPGYRRGIVHRATSPDLVAWTDAGVFYEHDGAVGKGRDLESVQYLVKDGWHHLFFVEQDLNIDNHPTSHMVADGVGNWTMANRDVVDAGWAPEVMEFDPGQYVFARLAKDQDPRDGSWFVTMKTDSLDFVDAGATPVVRPSALLTPAWQAIAGEPAVTFGENSQFRLEAGLGHEGVGWFSSYEKYGGPLSGVGNPGMTWGDLGTMRMESRPFVVSGGHLRLLLAGGYAPNTCYVALLHDGTGAELARIHANSPQAFGERLWDLGPWLGQTVRLAVVDEETGPGGWIAVDGIEERVGGLAAVGEHFPAGTIVGRVRAHPNPFNPRTEIVFEAGRDGLFAVELYDLAGRRVWRSEASPGTAGTSLHVVWNGQDQAGRSLPSGAYLARIVAEGGPVASLRVMLVR